MADLFRPAIAALKETADALIAANVGIKKMADAVLAARDEHEDVRETNARLESELLNISREVAALKQDIAALLARLTPPEGTHE